MKTQVRSILAASVVAATMSAGCVAIIATDDDHYPDDCSDCHYTVYYKQTGDADSTGVAMDTTNLGPCTR